MKKFATLFVAFVAMVSCGGGNKTQKETEDVQQRQPSPIGFYEEDFLCRESEVESGETFSGIMSRLELPSSSSFQLLSLTDSVFDVRKMRAGNVIKAYYSCPDSLTRNLEYVVYENDRITSTVFKCRDSLAVWTYSKPVEKQRRKADITIKSSLWNDMIEAGASPMLIMELADIYQWSVNFFALQKDDRFRFIYTQSVCGGEVIRIDTVHFCIFNGGGREIPALRYDIGKGATYWGKDGESLKRLFLKAPLRYNRISSRFTYHRKHPITGKVRAHTAVDYAAPKGTPVHSIGEGTVTLCGWDGSGGGNRIRIKHPMGYESCYMHLQKFAPGIKAGSRVAQGQLIGYVGSTGASTGPHLDFRIWAGGKPVDPLTLNSPAAEPLDRKYLDGFNKVYQEYLEEMGGEQ